MNLYLFGVQDKTARKRTRGAISRSRLPLSRRARSLYTCRNAGVAQGPRHSLDLPCYSSRARPHGAPHHSEHTLHALITLYMPFPLPRSLFPLPSTCYTTPHPQRPPSHVTWSVRSSLTPQQRQSLGHHREDSLLICLPLDLSLSKVDSALIHSLTPLPISLWRTLPRARVDSYLFISLVSSPMECESCWKKMLFCFFKKDFFMYLRE